MVIAGSLCTIFGKIMDQKVMINEEGASGSIVPHLTEFKHPLLLNLLMFMGEASLLIVLHFQLRNDSAAAAIHEKNKANRLVFLVPAILDTFGSFLNFTALAYISASTYQILKMLTMPFVVLLSIIFLRRSFSLTQYLAVLTVIFGLLVTTLTDIYWREDKALPKGETKTEIQAMSEEHE